MNMRAFKRNEQGLTLIEILAALVIISIVILGITAFFSTSVKTTDTTEKLLDASYVNQRYMEELYRISRTGYAERDSRLAEGGWVKEAENEYVTESSGYYIDLAISDSDAGAPLRRILIRVFEDSEDQHPASQMETIRRWE